MKVRRRPEIHLLRKKRGGGRGWGVDRKTEGRATKTVAMKPGASEEGVSTERQR